MTTILELPLGQIDTGQNRARHLDVGQAEALADSIRMQGLLYPVLVRQTGDRYRLVDGLHRHEAHRLLGLATIPAIPSKADSDDAARLDEVMANLARRMVALDFCRHLYELKEVWLRLHPETAKGGDKNVQKGRDAAKRQKLAFGEQEPEIIAFDGAMAEKFDLGRSTVREAVAIWNGLSAVSHKRLHGTALAEKKTELKALSKEKHPRQAQILDLILSPDRPEITSIAEAIFHLDNGVTPNPIEKRFLTVSRSLGTLDDTVFDNVIAAHEARVIASLKRRGRI